MSLKAIALVVAFAAVLLSQGSHAKSPVVIVPGIAGSQLWAFEKDPAKRYQIWVSLSEIYLQREVVPQLILDYDQDKRMAVDNHGLETGPGYFGLTRGIEKLDDSMSFAGIYFYYLVEMLTKIDPFYVRDKTIRGAPYDFRFTPRDKPEMIQDMKRLVEETYESTNGTKVTILGHSYGCPNAAIFLNSMSIFWRHKYIDKFISISGVFGGSVKSLMCHISGCSINLPLMSHKTLRPLLRTMPGLSAILPHPSVFGDEKPMILTDKRNYTANEYFELYQDFDSLNSYYMWEDSESMYRKMTIPPWDVKTVCIYGYGLNTMEGLDYREGRFPEHDPVQILGPGDGTVNMKSLELCNTFYNTEVFTFEKAEHFAVVSDPRVLRLLRRYF